MRNGSQISRYGIVACFLFVALMILNAGNNSQVKINTNSLPPILTVREPASANGPSCAEDAKTIVGLNDRNGEFEASLRRLKGSLENSRLPADVKRAIYNEFETPQRSTVFDISILGDNGKELRFHAFRILHNNKRGPGKGGIRFGPDADLSEVSALSMGMTFKAPLTNLPLGGAKGGVQMNPKVLSNQEKAKVARAYFGYLSERGLVGPKIDVPAPDMNTNPQIMELMLDEHLRIQFQKGYFRDPELNAAFAKTANNGKEKDPEATKFVDAYIDWAERSHNIAEQLGTITGKAVGRGGSRGRTEATGLGVYYVAREYVKVKFGKSSAIHPMRGLSVAMQGFGNVGSHAAMFFNETGGASVVRLVDFVGGDKAPFAVFDAVDAKLGLPIQDMFRFYQKNKTLDGFSHFNVSVKKTSEADALNSFLSADVDMLVPAALGNQIRKENQYLVKAKAIIEAANNPTSPEAESALIERNIDVVPDILANAGGVTVSYFEMLQNATLAPNEYWSVDKVFSELDERMTKAFNDVAYRKLGNPSLTWRNAAQVVSLEKLAE